MAETKIRVPLKKVIEGIEMATDEWNQYLDIETMEIQSLPDGGYFGDWMEEFEEISEKIDNGRKTRYFALPDKFDIHEYSIIERFVYDMPSRDGCRMNLSAPLTAEAHSAASNLHSATMAWRSSGMITSMKPTAKSPSGGAMTTDLSTMRRMTNEAFIT